MKYTILAVLCTVLMMSCSTDDAENYEVGSDFVENDINIKVIDTFTVNTGTYQLDSVITSGTSRMLLGCVQDQYLGKVKSKTYFQLQNYLFSLDDNAVFDSIGFVMHYDTYYYGDTLQPQTYKVRQVIETFEPYDDNTSFYNTSKLVVDNTEVIGEVTFIPRPNRSTDSLYIPIDPEFGENIFNGIVDNDINNVDDFLQLYKGFSIEPDTLTSSHILGFNASSTTGLANNSSMRLYYSVESEYNDDESQYIEFVVSSTSKIFNAISSDVSSTDVSGLNGVETVISSEETNDLYYAQAGTGISARIDIPAIKRLKEISEVGTTLDAELTFEALKGSYNDNNPLQDSLSVYVVDHKNRIMNLLTNSDGATAYALLQEEDNEFNSNIYYSVDLSGFVEDILYLEEDLDYSLMIQFKELSNSVDRVVLKNPEKESERVKLTVKYLNY